MDAPAPPGGATPGDQNKKPQPEWVNKPLLLGRPEKIEESRIERITAALVTGSSRRAASTHGGISYNTFLNWYNKGKACKSEPKPNTKEYTYFCFFCAVTRAEDQCELRMIHLVAKAAESDPKYAVWWLSRRRNADFGNRIDIGKIPDDRLIELLEQE